VCGSDICGGSCGECGAGEACEEGACVEGACVPACAGLACGDDGCGGSCGACAPGKSCEAGACVDGGTPGCSCEGRSCGDDGCGNSCGTCALDETCDGSKGQCVYTGTGSPGDDAGTGGSEGCPPGASWNPILNACYDPNTAPGATEDVGPLPVYGAQPAGGCGATGNGAPALASALLLLLLWRPRRARADRA
jgi:uncharacterized protein (TIGR03382 family)